MAKIGLPESKDDYSYFPEKDRKDDGVYVDLLRQMAAKNARPLIDEKPKQVAYRVNWA